MFTKGDIDNVIQASVDRDGDLSFPDGNSSMHLELAPEIVESAVIAKVLPTGLSAIHHEYTNSVRFLYEVPRSRLLLASRPVYEHELKVRGRPGRDGIVKVLVEAHTHLRLMLHDFEEAKRRTTA